MATENRTPDERIEGNVPVETGTGKRGRRKNTGTADAGTGTGTGTGNSTGAGTTEKEKLSELVTVKTDPVSTPVPEKPKQTKRPRKNTNKSKNNATFNSEQITALLMSMNAILSQSESGKFFAITEKEAEQIAKPLANIIAKNDSFAGLGEHSDSIALTTACIMIFIPRLIGWLTYRRTKLAMKKNNVMIMKGDSTNGKKTENRRGSGTVEGTTTPVNENLDNGVMSLFPSLA